MSLIQGVTILFSEHDSFGRFVHPLISKSLVGDSANSEILLSFLFTNTSSYDLEVYQRDKWLNLALGVRLPNEQKPEALSQVLD